MARAEFAGLDEATQVAMVGAIFGRRGDPGQGPSEFIGADPADPIFEFMATARRRGYKLSTVSSSPRCLGTLMNRLPSTRGPRRHR